MVSLMNLTVDMMIEWLSYIEVMMIWNSNVDCAEICVRIILLIVYCLNLFRYRVRACLKKNIIFCIIKEQILFSRCAPIMHDVLYLIIKIHYLAWTFSLLKYTISPGPVFIFSFCYSSGHLSRKPYGYFRCPGNEINAVLMWLVFCGAWFNVCL